MLQKRGATLGRYPRIDEREKELIWSFLNFLNFIVHKTHLENQLKQTSRPHLRNSDSVGLEWGCKIFIFKNHLPVDTDAASQD